MSEFEQTTAEADHRYHHYTGNEIPWYVRLIWLMFWVFLIYYTMRYLFPAVQVEMVSPP